MADSKHDHGAVGEWPGSRPGLERNCLTCATLCGVISMILGGCIWVMLAPVLYNGIIEQNFVTSTVRSAGARWGGQAPGRPCRLANGVWHTRARVVGEMGAARRARRASRPSKSRGAATRTTSRSTSTFISTTSPTYARLASALPRARPAARPNARGVSRSLAAWRDRPLPPAATVRGRRVPDLRRGRPAGVPREHDQDEHPVQPDAAARDVPEEKVRGATGPQKSAMGRRRAKHIGGDGGRGCTCGPPPRPAQGLPVPAGPVRRAIVDVDHERERRLRLERPQGRRRDAAQLCDGYCGGAASRNGPSGAGPLKRRGARSARGGAPAAGSPALEDFILPRLESVVAAAYPIDEWLPVYAGAL